MSNEELEIAQQIIDLLTLIASANICMIITVLSIAIVRFWRWVIGIFTN